MPTFSQFTTFCTNAYHTISFRDLARIHCALYGGSLEVLVTQGDTVYKAEAEAVCTRTGASRAEYIAQLRTQSAQNSTTSRKSNRNNNSKSGDCDDEGYQAAEDAATSARASAGAGTMIHPLLIAPAPPLQHSTPTTSSAADDEVEDGWVGNSRISETYDRCSEVCNAAQIRNTSNDGPLAGNVNNKSNSVTQAPPKSVNNNGGSGGGGGGGGKCGGSSGDVTTTAEFFDPLLRPPPKVVPPWNTALLLLVPLMLGIHSVNKEYIEVRTTLLYIEVTLYLFFFTYFAVERKISTSALRKFCFLSAQFTYSSFLALFF